MILCSPKRLPQSEWVAAAATAVSFNPSNRPAIERISAIAPGVVLEPAHLALLVTKYWTAGKVDLTVAFMEQTAPDLAARIVSHMNAWSQFANVQFHLTGNASTANVRISREPGGYWSYLGTDILHIPTNQQTMNLEAFTMQTPESEFVRVVRHETGHTLGFPHEHMRRQIVDLLDRNKALLYFERTQGWSQQEVIDQVLTPLEEQSIRGTPNADTDSIMCYQIPGECTVSGAPIPGGADIDQYDRDFAAKQYPKAVAPPSAKGVSLEQAQAAALGAIDTVAAQSWVFGAVVRNAKAPVASALEKLWL